MAPRLPEFLIIGAMKSGTTTLYEDLATQDAVFMSPQKEPHALLKPSILTESGKESYAKLFRNARSDQLCGEASTGYTMRPVHEGVAKTARALLGPDAKIIYLVRNPIERTISQHFHMYSRDLISADINQEIRKTPSLLNFSRYDMQLEPWLDEFGLDAIKVIRFEDFVEDRLFAMKELGEFLGFAPVPEVTDPDAVYNVGKSSRRKSRSALRPLLTSRFYARYVRPFIPSSIRPMLRLLGKRTVPSPPGPSPETLNYMIGELTPAVERLGQMLNQSELLWDLDATRQRLSERGDSRELPLSK